MLKQFFIICSGADTDILETCSKGEQNKYAGIGATVFFTALMAFIAASYALYTVFDNLFTALFKLFYCHIISFLIKSKGLYDPFSSIINVLIAGFSILG